MRASFEPTKTVSPRLVPPTVPRLTLRPCSRADARDILRDPRFFLPGELKALASAGLAAIEALKGLEDTYNHLGVRHMWARSYNAICRVVKILYLAYVRRRPPPPPSPHPSHPTAAAIRARLTGAPRAASRTPLPPRPVTRRLRAPRASSASSTRTRTGIGPATSSRSRSSWTSFATRRMTPPSRRARSFSSPRPSSSP